MAVDIHDEEIRRRDAKLDKYNGKVPLLTKTQGYWPLGSRQRKMELGLYMKEIMTKNQPFADLVPDCSLSFKKYWILKHSQVHHFKYTDFITFGV